VAVHVSLAADERKTAAPARSDAMAAPRPALAPVNNATLSANLKLSRIILKPQLASNLNPFDKKVAHCFFAERARLLFYQMPLIFR
jgi:hypothetical protein